MAKQHNFKKLVIGYSFGISRTSGPGRLNETIAKRIAKELGPSHPTTFLGVQWEIEDALRKNKSKLPTNHVVASKPFREGDIIDLEQLKSSARKLSKVLTKALGKDCLHPNLEDCFIFPSRAVIYLNLLLQNSNLFKKFQWLTLPTLKKKKNGRDWDETRDIPPKSEKLQTYQVQRLNRLILEAALTGLQNADYMATFHVADAVLKKASDQGFTSGEVHVYGHPAHVKRCRIQTIESAWKIGLKLDQNKVIEKPCGPKKLNNQKNWDRYNAQEWIRNWKNWKEHEGI